MAEAKGIVITGMNGVVDDADLPKDLDISLESLRCISCERHLGYYALIEGTVAIKCRRCHCWNILDARAKLDNENAP